jgi:hypothetical protein
MNNDGVGIVDLECLSGVEALSLFMGHNLVEGDMALRC